MLLPVCLVITLVLGLTTYVYLRDLQRNYLEAIEWRSESLAQAIFNNIQVIKKYKPGYLNDIPGLLRKLSERCEQLYELNQGKQITHFAVIEESGEIAAHNDPDMVGTPVNERLLPAIRQQKTVTIPVQDVYHTLIPIVEIEDDQDIYLGTIDIGIPKALIDHKIRDLLRKAGILFGGFLLAAVLIISGWLHLIVLKPLKRLLDVAAAIANGDFSQKIPAGQQDEIGDLARAFRYMKERINLMLEETGKLLNDVRDGHLDARGHGEAFRGDWKSLVNRINDVLDAFVIPFKMTAAHLDRMAKGELPDPIHAEYQGDFDEIKHNLNALIESSHAVTRVAEAIADGQLDVEARQRSEHDRLMQALNHMIEAFLKPLNTTSRYLDRIAKGDLPAPITEEYKGDFNLIKENLNLLIRASQEITHVAHEMEQGNLLVTVRQRSEHDILMHSLNRMIRHVTEAMGSVKNTAEDIASGSRHLRESSESMSQGAAQQASATEEVSSSMEEMVANITQNTDNARRTEQLAAEASQYAREGAGVVAETVVAMEQIAEKILVIQDIAMQTRLLSLNATIESARAHEHGRAFSVVASEVRKLSDVTKKAAEEISQLATSTLHISHKAGEMLNTLAPSIEQTAELVQDIAAASSEQRSGAEHINTAMQQLDLVTQQNASTSEEVAVAAEELNKHAEILRKTVAFFRFERNNVTEELVRPAESDEIPWNAEYQEISSENEPEQR